MVGYTQSFATTHNCDCYTDTNNFAIFSLLCGFQIRNRFGARFHPDFIQISSRFDSKSRNRFRDQIRKMSSEFGLKEFLTEI